MQAKFILFIIFTLVSFDSNAGPGGLGGIVFDPTGYVQTTISASKAIAAEIQRANQLLLQAKQLTHLADQAKNFSPSSLKALLDQSTQGVTALQAYAGSMSTLLDDTKNLTSLFQARAVEMRAGGMSASEYANQEAARIASGDKVRQQMMDNELALLKSVDQDVVYVRETQAKINDPNLNAAGSAQLMNSQLSKLVAQNATLIQFMTANSAISKSELGIRATHKLDAAGSIAAAVERDRQAVQALAGKLASPPPSPAQPPAVPPTANMPAAPWADPTF